MLLSASANGAQLHAQPMTDNGLDAVRDTLQRMVAIVRKYKSDVSTITAARRILVAAGIRDSKRETPAAIRAIQHWVRDNIVYVPDPFDLEMIQTPPRTLSIGTGDCDDKAILVATLLATIGMTTRFAAVGFAGQSWTDIVNAPYSHVLALVRFGNRWLSLETIVPSAEPGWWPPGVACLMVRTV